MDVQQPPVALSDLSTVFERLSSHFCGLAHKIGQLETAISQNMHSCTELTDQIISELQLLDSMRQSMEDLDTLAGSLSRLEQDDFTAPALPGSALADLRLAETRALLVSSPNESNRQSLNDDVDLF